MGGWVICKRGEGLDWARVWQLVAKILIATATSTDAADDFKALVSSPGSAPDICYAEGGVDSIKINSQAACETAEEAGVQKGIRSELGHMG
ncbi:hypothetical protein PSPO01_04312 [Paraphaeosphaeria sporulosa]